MLFTVWSGLSSARGLDESRLALKDLETGERRWLLSGAFPRYVKSGHVLFMRTDGLWAVPFDAQRLEITGPEQLVLEGLRLSRTGFGEFAVAENGSLAYAPGAPAVDSDASTLPMMFFPVSLPPLGPLSIGLMAGASTQEHHRARRRNTCPHQ